METAESLKVNGRRAKFLFADHRNVLALRKQIPSEEFKLEALPHDGPNILQALMVTTSKSHILGPFSSRKWTEPSKVAKSQAPNKADVGACTSCINRFFHSCCVEPLAETDE